MSKTQNNHMQFLFADRELILMVADLLTAPVDIIVNPANAGLFHGGGVAAQIVQQGGEQIQEESNLFINEHGVLESGMVAFTTAGNLPYQAVIHAVGPKMGEGDEQQKIQQAISRSLQLCDMHNWKSVAFPAISTGIFSVPIEVSAAAMFRAITSFWDARSEGSPEKVIICLTQNKFQPFFDAFREESSHSEVENLLINDTGSLLNKENGEAITGIVNLSEQDISDLDNDELNNWFK